VYTQAVTPAKHAAQAAVLSLVFSCEANATSPPTVSCGVAARTMEDGNWPGEKGHKKGHKNLPFWVLDGFAKISASALERMAGTTRLELATSAVTGQRSNQLNYVPTRHIDKMRNRRCLCGSKRIA